MTPVLQLIGVNKKYGVKSALDDCTLTIEKGKIIGLLGPNGSGKTTMIKLINGLLTATSGTVLINGLSPSAQTKAKVSYLPDKEYLNDWMKVSDLINFFADFYEDFDKVRAYDMLSKLNINPTDKLKTLSKGTKEKVQLILVMSRDADLYLLDEPIAGVDPAARDYIISTIINNYNENATVIISTHLITDIEKVLDEVIFIKNGKLVLHRDAEELRLEKGKSVDEIFREEFRC